MADDDEAAPPMGRYTGPYGAYDDEDIWRLAQLGLGEARGEGDKGIRAVMQVAANRSADQSKRWPSSIKDVALQKKQFSAFTPSIGLRGDMETFHRTRPKEFARMVRLAADVLAGDADGGVGNATHYYSPKGMEAYRNRGMQDHLIPPWLAREEARSGGRTVLGNHIFVGSAKGVSTPGRAPSDEEAGSSVRLASATDGGQRGRSRSSRVEEKPPAFLDMTYDEITKTYGDGPLATAMKESRMASPTPTPVPAASPSTPPPTTQKPSFGAAGAPMPAPATPVPVRTNSISTQPIGQAGSAPPLPPARPLPQAGAPASRMIAAPARPAPAMSAAGMAQGAPAGGQGLPSAAPQQQGAGAPAANTGFMARLMQLLGPASSAQQDSIINGRIGGSGTGAGIATNGGVANPGPLPNIPEGMHPSEAIARGLMPMPSASTPSYFQSGANL